MLLPLQTAVEAETKVWQQAVKDGDAFGAAISCKLLEADHYRARMHAYYVAHLKASMDCLILGSLSCCTAPQLTSASFCAQAATDALSPAELLLRTVALSSQAQPAAANFPQCQGADFLMILPCSLLLLRTSMR